MDVAGFDRFPNRLGILRFIVFCRLRPVVPQGITVFAQLVFQRRTDFKPCIAVAGIDVA